MKVVSVDYTRTIDFKSETTTGFLVGVRRTPWWPMVALLNGKGELIIFQRCPWLLNLLDNKSYKFCEVTVEKNEKREWYVHIDTDVRLSVNSAKKVMKVLRGSL